jgi:hypothetical protein
MIRLETFSSFLSLFISRPNAELSPGLGFEISWDMRSWDMRKQDISFT